MAHRALTAHIPPVRGKLSLRPGRISGDTGAKGLTRSTAAIKLRDESVQPLAVAFGISSFALISRRSWPLSCSACWGTASLLGDDLRIALRVRFKRWHGIVDCAGEHGAANLTVGITFSSLAQNQLQAVQLAIFYFLPNILLSGFMFPFKGMPAWAQVIGNLLPLTYFNRLIRGILLKGNGWSDSWASVWPMMVFTLALMGVGDVGAGTRRRMVEPDPHICASLKHGRRCAPMTASTHLRQRS